MTAPRPVDPKGTCHMVDCPLKGQHPPHVARLARLARLDIGAPDSFAPYEVPDAPRPLVCLPHGILVRVESLLNVTARAAGVTPDLRQEARILATAIKDAVAAKPSFP